MDLRRVDMIREGKNYAHGLAKYYLHEDIPAITSDYKQVVQMNQLQFNSDISFGMQTYKELRERNLRELYPEILDASKYDTYLKEVFFCGKPRSDFVSNHPVPVTG